MKFTHVIYEKCDTCIHITMEGGGDIVATRFSFGGNNIYRLNMHLETDRQL